MGGSPCWAAQSYTQGAVGAPTRLSSQARCVRTGKQDVLATRGRRERERWTHVWGEAGAVLVNLQVLHHLGKELRVPVPSATGRQGRPMGCARLEAEIARCCTRRAGWIGSFPNTRRHHTCGALRGREEASVPAPPALSDVLVDVLAPGALDVQPVGHARLRVGRAAAAGSLGAARWLPAANGTSGWSDGQLEQHRNSGAGTRHCKGRWPQPVSQTFLLTTA